MIGRVVDETLKRKDLSLLEELKKSVCIRRNVYKLPKRNMK